MLQKCAILGLVLLLAGGVAVGWLHGQVKSDREEARNLVSADSLGSQDYLETYSRWYQLSAEEQNQFVLEIDRERKSKAPAQLDREQQARLRADRDKLAAGQTNPGDIADFLYGRGWQQQVEEYKARKEQMEIARTIATVCLSLGGILFGGCVIGSLLWLLGRGIRALRRRARQPEPEPQSRAVELSDLEVPVAAAEPDLETPAPPETPRQGRKRLTLVEMSADMGEGVGELTACRDDWPRMTPGPGSTAAPAADLGGGVAVLLADEPAPAGGWSPEAQWSVSGARQFPSLDQARESRPAEAARAGGPDQKKGTIVENTLREQADDLQKQLAEFRQITQDVQQATREQSEPLGSTLKELTQQVAAIREYAASQQDRVEKLQDGYDWGIIRTFCLRVIRCLDNLEGRLAELPSGDSAAAHLEEVRDELLFALESSGVEQFRPELNSEFHGQEKMAEAIKERQATRKAEQAGKIARVLRPGYRYMIDDDNFRVVRTAQVKVFG
ncbi:MAG: nucleotide exchange factor GrpE [Planctomycetes bacterium]|jgi:molecular chaperone GrpE (heat shock protein)|nr:nucleotide exchange factor GrpE [Planctomycetota bacterium]